MFIHLPALTAFFCWDPHSPSSLHSLPPLPSRPYKCLPLSLQLDLGPQLLSLSDPNCGPWQTSKMGSSRTERKKDRSLPFLTPVLPKMHDSCNKRSSLDIRIHAPWKNNLLGKTCPKLRVKVLLFSIQVCKSMSTQCQVLGQDPEVIGELGGTGEIKGLGNKRLQV